MIHRLWMIVFPCGRVSNPGRAGVEILAHWVIPTLRARIIQRLFHRGFPRSPCPCLWPVTAIRRMLEQAGVEVVGRRAAIDEEAVKQAHDGDGAELALAGRSQGGCRSMRPATGSSAAIQHVSVDGTPLFQAARPRRSRAPSARLLGPDMHPVERGRAGPRRRSNGAMSTARLTSAAEREFIESYLDAEWPEVGLLRRRVPDGGARRDPVRPVEGSHFTILGMPLLPLLGALRERGGWRHDVKDRLTPKSSATRSRTAVAGDPPILARGAGIDADYRPHRVTRRRAAAYLAEKRAAIPTGAGRTSPCRSSSTRSTWPRKRPTARSRRARPICC
jgi:septum formation protein